MPVLTTRKIPGNNVVPATKHLPTVPYEKALRIALACSSIEAYSRDTKELVSPDQSSYHHGFIAAVNAAYAGHYPLVLSPDMIWLLIAQGFARHINHNAERLRNHFVAHQGKALLLVERREFIPGFAGNDWEGVFTEFSERIRAHIGEAAHQVIVPTFSTTGIVENAAFELTLMDAMQHYFEYKVHIICGIPSFILEGTLDDWKLLREKAEALTQYDLDWWIPSLLPVLDEFILASEGHPTPSFWENFCRAQTNGYCGPPKPSGATPLRSVRSPRHGR